MPVLSDEETDLFLQKYLEDQNNRAKWLSALSTRLDRIKSRRTHSKGVIARECKSNDGTAHLFVNEKYYDEFYRAGDKDV